MGGQKIRKRQVFFLMGALSALFLILFGAIWWYAWRHGKDITLDQLEQLINSTFFSLLSESVGPELRADLREEFSLLFRIARTFPLAEDDWNQILRLLRTMQELSNDGQISAEDVERIRTEIHSTIAKLKNGN